MIGFERSDIMNTAIDIMDNKPIIIVSKGGSEENVKYNLDGSVKLTHTNKLAGISSEVFGFTSQEDIAAMVKVFDKHIEEAQDNNKRQIAARNKMLFLVGINIGIRASDLRQVKWSYFLEDNGDGTFTFKKGYTIMPKKTAHKRKFVNLYFNQAIQKALTEYISIYPFESLDDYLFPSRKGNASITEASIWRILNETAKEAGIEQNIGSHSLRKTFGYWIWHNAEDKNKSLIILQQIFNHSSPATTAKYIGITKAEMEETFNSLTLGMEYAVF